MAKIAVGGWQHETNTFATIKADLAAFERADEWPPLSAGAELFEQTRGVHLPITGALEVLQQSSHELVPLLWCSATPSSYVTEHAYEHIAALMLERINQAMPLDGIYLDLHGAMVCEHLEDGEGELLRRIRMLVGNDIPVVVSLDLHANVTPAMVEYASALDIFRTYPHIDMGETGARAAALLLRIIEHRLVLHKSYAQTDFLIALNRGCSLIEPCQSIYQFLPELINDTVLSTSFACGFHLSDIHHVGPAVVSYGLDAHDVESASENLLKKINENRAVFAQKIWPVGEIGTRVRQLQQDGKQTIVLADTQDNPGGGGAGDTTGLLQAMVEAGNENAVFGVLSDPDVVAMAKRAGIGATLNVELGGKSGLPGQAPWGCEIQVLKLTDGNLIATGPMYKGARMTLGDCALVRIAGVLVCLSSMPVQTADQALFRHFDLEPSTMAVIGLKSSVHFRNDFTGLADEILVVAAPGAVFADPATLIYQNLRPGVAFS